MSTGSDCVRIAYTTIALSLRGRENSRFASIRHQDSRLLVLVERFGGADSRHGRICRGLPLASEGGRVRRDRDSLPLANELWIRRSSLSSASRGDSGGLPGLKARTSKPACNTRRPKRITWCCQSSEVSGRMRPCTRWPRIPFGFQGGEDGRMASS